MTTEIATQPSPGRARVRLMTVATVALAAAPVVVLAAAPSAQASLCSSAPGKCFFVSISPSSFVAGSTVLFKDVVTNEATSQSLGSANLDAPAGYTVSNVDAPSSGTSALSGNEVQLRNLDLAPGSSVSVTFTASTPSTAGSGAWLATAKQSNDYNGAGNDFVLDPGSALTTSGTTSATGSGAGCSAADVSCGTNFIHYDRASTVSTGTTVNSTVWFVGHMDFPATSVSGGQRYTMEAPSHPSNFCPVNGAPAQCTFEMRVDNLPAPYDAAHAATLTLLCDVSHCPSTSTYLLFKNDGTSSTALAPCVPGVSSLCFSTSRDSTSNALIVVISNITAGDPSFAGISVP